MSVRGPLVECFCSQLSTCLMAFAGSMQLSDLESLYPGFRTVYQRHLDHARFDTTLRLDPRFESLKLRLITVRYLLEKNPDLDAGARADLIRTVLLEGNFRRAQQTFPRSGTDEKKWSTPNALVAVGALFSTSSGPGESLEKEMRTLAAKVPDSHFLLMM